MTDDEFLKQFEDCLLPFAQWSHRAHVKLAYLRLRAHPFEDALVKVRDGIKAYNKSHGVPDTETSGYNETTTQAFLRLVAATMDYYGEVFPTDDADGFCDAHPQLMSRHVLRFFYSPEQRMRPEAKTQFVEPDLTSLPVIRRE